MEKGGKSVLEERLEPRDAQQRAGRLALEPPEQCLGAAQLREDRRRVLQELGGLEVVGVGAEDLQETSLKA